MLRRSFHYRIYPTPEQAAWLGEVIGAARFVYNVALEQRRDWWRQYRAATGKSLSYFQQSAELTAMRADAAWLAAIPRTPLDQVLRDLDKAFSTFFRKGAGFPRFRSLDRNTSCRFQGKECSVESLNGKWSSLRLPKCGGVKMRRTRALPANLGSVTVSHDAGQWFVSIAALVGDVAGNADGTSVGIDRGVANTFSISTGEHFRMPASIAAHEVRKRAAQRTMARAKKGSARRVKAKRIAAMAGARTARARNHWLHEQSTAIAARFGVVTLEALKIGNMTRSGGGPRKRGLNRSILAQGWGIFAGMLEYKLAERGGQVLYVNPAYTSQTCAECGSIDSRSRESQAIFRCIDCGHTAHADTNAALNILRRSPASVEGSGYGPVEARIGAMLTHCENLAA